MLFGSQKTYLVTLNFKANAIQYKLTLPLMSSNTLASFVTDQKFFIGSNSPSVNLNYAVAPLAISAASINNMIIYSSDDTDASYMNYQEVPTTNGLVEIPGSILLSAFPHF